jgi:hypothetical protein
MATPVTRTDIYIVFNPDVAKMANWTNKMGISMLTHAYEYDAIWHKAHPWLLQLNERLKREYGFEAMDPNNAHWGYDINRILFCSTVQHDYMQRWPLQRLELPKDATSFFNRNRRSQWEKVFHQQIVHVYRNRWTPLLDILCLIQCILPGIILFEQEELISRDRSVLCRGVPKPEWFERNKKNLAKIFSTQHLSALKAASKDITMSYSLEHKQVPRVGPLR